jgi:calcium-dependent protein kinase
MNFIFFTFRHFDGKVKFENILFETGHPDEEIKLIDFGLSRHFARSRDQRTGYGGSLYVMAPEVLQGKYNPKSDIWSVGVIAYMLLSGR